MNSKLQQFELIKRVLSNHQLKYVLRQYKDVSLQLNKDKQQLLEDIDEEAADYKFKTKQISFDDYCAIKKTYSKDFSELLTKNHAKISKYNLLKLYQIKGSDGHQKFEYMLLQKLSEHIGDMNLEEIISSLHNLRVYDKNVIEFQFNLLSQRILELTLFITNHQLIQIIFLFGKFDKGSEDLWRELTKLFLFRIEDLTKEDILQVIKGYAGSDRGNELFWNQVFLFFSKRCHKLIESIDFDITWILMRVKIQNIDFWIFLNQNYTNLLKRSAESPDLFYKFFKYNIQNILQISQVNQIELFDLLAEKKNQFDPIYQMKILKILTKNHLLTSKIVDSFKTNHTNLQYYQQQLQQFIN